MTTARKRRSTAGGPHSHPAPTCGVHKPSNSDIAAAFSEIADLLELENDNPFRIRAYRNAARTVGAFGRDIADLLRGGGTLPKLPGVGADLAGKIAEIANSGDLALLRRLRREVPASMVEMLQIGGLGPRRVQALYHSLDVQTPQQLLDAARAGRIRSLPGFGARLEQKLLAAAEHHLQDGRRALLADAISQAERLAAVLRRVPGVVEITIAGSLRRMRDTVGDIDLLAVASAESPVMSRFVADAGVGEVLSQGPTRASVVLRTGLQVDLRVMAPETYGAALVYFTGSKAHNIAIRRIAQQRGLKISEYGVFKGDKRVAGDTEASVYRSLGLSPIAPELRENLGEIEAAATGRLPRLIERQDLRGDLHAHTRATDGLNTIEEMAVAAKSSGLEYLAITDHSRRLAVAHGLDAERLLRQTEEIDRINERIDGITLLKGVEVDILEHGGLDLADDVLRRLDLVVVAVHSHFDLSRTKQTQRLLRALDHPCVTLLAHPFARLLGERVPLDVDMSAVIAAARQRGCYLELNAQPKRMDLWDAPCREAREQGVLISIDSDAHSVSDFTHLRYGVGQARRGWLEAKHVLNAHPLGELRQLLRACFRR